MCSRAIKIANITDLKKKKQIEKKSLEQFGSKTEIKELLNKLEEEFKKKVVNINISTMILMEMI